MNEKNEAPVLPGEVWRGMVVLPFGATPILCAVVTNSEGGIVTRRNEGDGWPVLRAEFDRASVLIAWALSLRGLAAAERAYRVAIEGRYAYDEEMHEQGECEACDGARLARAALIEAGGKP